MPQCHSRAAGPDLVVTGVAIVLCLNGDVADFRSVGPTRLMSRYVYKGEMRCECQELRHVPDGQYLLHQLAEGEVGEETPRNIIDTWSEQNRTGTDQLTVFWAYMVCR